MKDLRTLYQTDYAAWAKRHVELLRARRFAEMDIEHLLGRHPQRRRPTRAPRTQNRLTMPRERSNVAFKR